jgi:hypothetical protein
MIHGGADTYIKPEIARALFARARRPKDFWLVDGAKHNQALQVAADGYRQRVLSFFQEHLADAIRAELPLSQSIHGLPAGLQKSQASLVPADNG